MFNKYVFHFINSKLCLVCSPSPSKEEATSKTDIIASHTKKDQRQQLDIENQALNALIADSNSFAANILDSFDHLKIGNGVDAQLATNHNPTNVLGKEKEAEDKTGDSAVGQYNGNHTHNGKDETDMREVCLGSDMVDGVTDLKVFPGLIHDGLDG